MLMDERNEFADATALNTGAAGSYLVGDVIDPASIAPNVTVDLVGSELFLVIQVDTLPTSAGAATAAFSLASDAQAAIAVDGSQTEHFRTKAFSIAEMAAGAMLACVKLPRGNYERYLGVVQTTAVAAFTGGKINAFLTADPAIWKAYADNV
ncbi:Bbp16 family capsid cement protein [Hydrogenophaga sp.]|uniref:Bbp16 family capsid cement protein n=1 Tax=Hydrogenophaga sp. TaxID=1904254 RepID=UPI0025BDB80F|nr:hypothetical protein [Hydrogenophaga sp.]MBT9467213.1 hypothetical protein [Hydrogenophaga sp.]